MMERSSQEIIRGCYNEGNCTLFSQINLQSNKTGWWAAQTKFADLTEQEFARKYLMTEFKTPATYDKLIKGKSVIV